MARQCPHSYEMNQRNKENDFAAKTKQVNFNLLVAMFTGYAREEDGRLKSLLDESKGCAIIDSGCATTVCGVEWIKDFIDNLSKEEQKNVIEKPSREIYFWGWVYSKISEES